MIKIAGGIFIKESAGLGPAIGKVVPKGVSPASGEAGKRMILWKRHVAQIAAKATAGRAAKVRPSILTQAGPQQVQKVQPVAPATYGQQAAVPPNPAPNTRVAQ